MDNNWYIFQRGEVIVALNNFGADALNSRSPQGAVLSNISSILANRTLYNLVIGPTPAGHHPPVRGIEWHAVMESHSVMGGSGLGAVLVMSAAAAAAAAGRC